MLSMDQKVTMGDIKRLEEMANSLLEIAQTAKTELGEAIANDDALVYEMCSVDLIDEVDSLWMSIGDWCADFNDNAE